MEKHHHHQDEHRPGLRYGVEGGEHVHPDEEHHEKKSVMNKVKAKARKIKDSITGHGHEHEAHGHDDVHAHHHDDDDDGDDDDEMEEDPEVHGAPIYESKEEQSYVPGQAATRRDVTLSDAHHGPGDVMFGGPHLTPTAAGTKSSIQHDVMLGGAHGTTTATPMATGHHGTTATATPIAIGHHRTTTATSPTTMGHNGTTTVATPTAVGHNETAPTATPTVVGHHETAPTTTPMAVGHHGTTPTTAPMAVARHGPDVLDVDSGLKREGVVGAHEMRDYRGFIPEQVGMSKRDGGVTFGGSKTPNVAAGGAPTQPVVGHSLGCGGAHDTYNLPMSSSTGDKQQVVFPQKIGILDRQSDLEPDPHTPRGDREPENYQSKVTDPTGRGGEELGISSILHSLDKMTTNDDELKAKTSRGQQESMFKPNTAGLDDKNRSLGTKGQPLSSGTGSHDQFSPEPISSQQQQGSSYADKVSSATSMITDKAFQAKNAVASKLGYGGEGDHHEAAKTSSSLYDKGVSTKEYLTEKVSPGEEDKALSEVISGALHKATGKEEEKNEHEKGAKPVGKVTFSAKVMRQLGEGDEESAEDLGSGVSGPAGGGGMVDTLKDTVSSWLGIGGKTEPASVVWHDIPKDEGNTGHNQQQQQQGHGTDKQPRLH